MIFRVSILFALLLTSSICFSQQAKYNIEALDSSLDFSHLEGKYNVTGKPRAKKSSGLLISVSHRDAIFEQAGIEKFIKSWDQLDRDMLYMRARKKPLDYLINKYPKIDEQTLRELKELVGKAQ